MHLVTVTQNRGATIPFLIRIFKHFRSRDKENFDIEKK